MKSYIFLLICVIPSLCFAQIDSSYIKPFEQRLAIRTYLEKNFISLNQQIDSKTDKMFMPNNPVNIGFGISLNNTIIDFSYGYGFDFMRDKEKGKTKSFDFQIHHYGRKFVLDLFIQKYRGFYLDNDRGKNIELFPDLKIRQYGLYGQYVFNNKQYSYQAAFVQNERQLKSAGSFLVGGGVYLTKIESDSSFVYLGKNTFENFQFGFSAGYAYTWVLSPKWFISASSTIGINFGSEKVNRFGRQKLEVYPTIFPRVSAGYNKEGWSLGFSYVSNMLFPSIVDGTNLNILSGNFQLTYILRLNSFSLFGKKWI